MVKSRLWADAKEVWALAQRDWAEGADADDEAEQAEQAKVGGAADAVMADEADQIADAGETQYEGAHDDGADGDEIPGAEIVICGAQISPDGLALQERLQDCLPAAPNVGPP